MEIRKNPPAEPTYVATVTKRELEYITDLVGSTSYERDKMMGYSEEMTRAIAQELDRARVL